MKTFKWRVLLICFFLILSIVFFLPSVPDLYKRLPDSFKRFLPSKAINLGLDLQGGMHLVLEVDVDKAVENSTERVISGLKDLFREKNITYESIKREGDKIIISSEPQSRDKIKKLIGDDYPILNLGGEDAKGLFYAVSNRERERIKDNAASQAIETIRNRIDQFGVAEPLIQRQGVNEILVQLPGIKDPQRAINLIGRTALLEFKLLDEDSPEAAQFPNSILPGEEEKLLKEFAGKIPEGDEVLFERIVNRETGRVIKRPYLIKEVSMLTGELLTEARVNIDEFNEPYVSITFNSIGAKLFDKITSENVKKRLAIILDGNVYSAPVIQERISGGKAQISGRFAMDEAKDLAIVLRAGALPAPVRIIQNLTVGPSLGKDSIEKGVRASILGAILVVFFMAIYYKFSGVIADFAVVLNVIMLLGVMASLNATLTLPGIAGIILTIGMGVDSNVLIFERIREELRFGKTVRAAIDAGYDKAFLTIVDSHVTTLITAFVLFMFGTGPIKGFAVSLSLGIIINLFTALVGTKVVFDWITTKRRLETLSI